MDRTRSDTSAGDERLYEQLAELLEAREGSTAGSVETSRLVRTDPEVASKLTAYFEAADLVSRMASGLTPPRTAARSRHMPARIGDYELLREIGRGGTAVVYEARQAGLNRPVAIKMLCQGRPGSMFDIERLRFEAEAVAHLAHPGIVPVYDVGEHDGCPWFSMQLYEHGSLGRAPARFTDDPRRAAGMVETIAHAVHHAHQRGILHRDLKPSNILLDADDRPSVADFGLAKRMGDDHDLTRPGELIGTPSYMAPERVGGSAWSAPATIATDVYGLGAILYALLTGRPPFEAATPVETLLAVGTADVIRPSMLNPRIDRDLETICLKALEKNPLDRYASAADVAQDLRAWLDGEPILARPIHGVERLRRWTRRHPVRAVVAIAAAVLLLVGSVGLATGYVVVSDAYRDAERHRKVAVSNAAELNRRLYVSQMSLAHRHLERGELNEMRAALDRYRGQPDLQGFEWRWLNRHALAMPERLALFTGHTHFLYGAAFSRDGRTVASCGADGTIRLWETVGGRELQRLENGAGLSPAGIPYDENVVVFRPDGRSLVSCGEDGGVRLWDLQAGTRRTLSPTPASDALAAALSPDGQRLAVGWGNGHVEVWDIDSGTTEPAIPDVNVAVCGVRFSPRGDELLTVDRAGTIRIWNFSEQQTRLTIPLAAPLLCVDVSPDGSQLAAAGQTSKVFVCRTDDGRVSHEFAASDVGRAVAFSPDGRRLASAGSDGCVRVWSVAGHTLQSRFKAHSSTIWNLSFSSDGERLLTASGDRTAAVWRLAVPDEPAGTSRVSFGVDHAVYSPDGRTIAVVQEDHQVLLCQSGNLDAVRQLPIVGHNTVRPVFSDDNRYLLLVNRQNAIQRWDLARGEWAPLDPLPVNGKGVPQMCSGLALLSGGRIAATTFDRGFFIHDGTRWQPARDVPGQPGFMILGKLPDEQTLIVLRDLPPSVELWTVAGLKIVRHERVAEQAATAAASPNGRWLVLGRGDGTIERLDRWSGNQRDVLTGHHGHIKSLRFAPDGRTLATASYDGTARLWNVGTGTELFAIAEADGPLHSVDFSRDGAALLVAGTPHGEALGTMTVFRIAPASPE